MGTPHCRAGGRRDNDIYKTFHREEDSITKLILPIRLAQFPLTLTIRSPDFY
jgi:hypothetical protein